MADRYGVPYKGSKNKIAKRIVELLPSAPTLYDIFAGGCAITHAAMESGKYTRHVANDYDGAGCELFTRAVRGEYRDERRWISREDFYQWCEAQAALVVISEYSMPPDRFSCIADIPHVCGMSGQGGSPVSERLFVVRGREGEYRMRMEADTRQPRLFDPDLLI